ncbi:MAG: ABC transporter ATP-binding protein [Deferrisomatales bacterium]|nr:ABC transporter ATP-binding protein [Deferrisomatales bacterium]
MIRAEGICVRRGGRGRPAGEVLRGVSLALGSGELVAVLGRPGSGKTTLLEGLAGLLPLSRGRVELRTGAGAWSWEAGREPPAAARRACGLLFQYPERQLVGRTPREDACWGLGGADPEAAAREGLLRAGVPEELWGAAVERLSRGEKRRVALAGILARRPEVLLLDEPSVGLDPEGQRLVWEEVAAFRATGGAVVVATHWPEALLPVASRVLCLDGGEERFQGTPAELLAAAGRDAGLRGLLPFAWRLGLALGAEGPLPAEARPWGEAAREWLRDAGRVPLPAGQPPETTPCSAAQTADTSSRRPSSRS